MTEKRVLLDTAAFLDSPQALRIDAASTKEIREITHRFLSACLEGVGKTPRLLDGDDIASLLTTILPRYFGARDPLAGATTEVLAAYFEHLEERELVPGAFEIRQALSAHEDDFVAAVESGAAHAEGIAVTNKPKPIVHRGDKVGRNDPCPCGSGKKFKKCCMNLG